MHVTDGFALRAIMEHSGLKTSKCPVHEESLLYFSYGRPAYKPNASREAIRLMAEAPVCIVVKPNAIKNKYVYPFDSGAFDRYRESMHRRMTFRDFALSPSIESAKKIVSTFYGTNQAYFDVQLKDKIEYSKGHFEVESFLSVIRDNRGNAYDDRIAAIEVVTDHACLLNGKVHAIVLPGALEEDDDFKKLLTAARCEILTYPWTARLTSREYVAQIALIVRDYLKEKGWL